ncbi:hypothetical protein A3F00_03725 [Candidatus Daviesbacteria bacterium RIFCSPHIGHO2_12_FULL_37_11]|uniref:TIGR00374 family protein n=1 Tax=Candidatus Daviesbacteria bacterium RIFCSPHIGHO2_12_FULL_37_11 TaxID=1797777 RepID=A0A1F5KCI5_9BACT|nr:MAG: hypothetical protein A2769_00375 [Candidatus Daviesbacteria bacterium RIFCSPHIGHO2_01_FULL_37_27]OGE38652.1 MAG: hypothetical protein A3F00_03725 [Candidatus Daviesbacteria bacterium RIFCSPHIGHO2_12_FULL_37_11]OGE45976.1 MAG: hypothetical protein A3B39_02995 [Candidatus Daviesbacteria bacterium RIFCSPLOWO2_01_FULL_37_10]
MFSTRNLVKIVLNTLLGIVLVFVWLKFVNISEIINTISKVNVINLLPVFIFIFVAQFLRSVKLKIFLAPVKKIRLKDLIFLNGAATMLNFLIPIRAGEIAKGIYISKNYETPLSRALVWIFLDRFIDFLVVLALVGPLLLIIPTSIPDSIIFITIIIFTMVIFFLYLAIFQVVFSRKIVSFLSKLLIVNIIKLYFERISNFLLDSLSILKRKPQELLLIFGVTLLAFGSDASIWYFTFLALDSSQNFLTLYLAQLLSALTYLIPAAPGYVGSAEASGLLIFSGVFGIDANLSSAMIVLFHVLTLIWIITFGVISVYFLKIDLGSILKRIFRK